MVHADFFGKGADRESVGGHIRGQHEAELHGSPIIQERGDCKGQSRVIEGGMRLKSRTRFPPGGFRAYFPQTNFSIQPWVSFDTAVEQIRQHRLANPHQSQVNNWSTDPAVIAAELDAWNTNVCVQMGWMDYVTEGEPEALPPKALSPQWSSRQSGRLAAGIKTIARWEIAGGQVVSRELANARAKVCSTCIKNELGDLSTFFTEAAAHLIAAQLGTKNNMKLTTDFDPLLGICQACGCVNKLKIWAPIDIIRSEMKDEIKAALAEQCWVNHEK
jgi:hypothetical protein